MAEAQSAATEVTIPPRPPRAERTSYFTSGSVDRGGYTARRGEAFGSRYASHGAAVRCLGPAFAPVTFACARSVGGTARAVPIATKPEERGLGAACVSSFVGTGGWSGVGPDCFSSLVAGAGSACGPSSPCKGRGLRAGDLAGLRAGERPRDLAGDTAGDRVGETIGERAGVGRRGDDTGGGDAGGGGVSGGGVPDGGGTAGSMLPNQAAMRPWAAFRK